MKNFLNRSSPFLFALISLAGFLCSFGQAAERIAFVVGVDKYEHLPKEAQLSVAVDDATAMAEALRGLDPPFEVTLLTDVKQDAAEEAFDEFLDDAKSAECAFVYFAGHGIEYFGTNYLIVSDTDIAQESTDVARMKRRLGNEALSLQAMVDSMETTGAKVKLVVLDCCRDNPIEAEKAGGTRSTVGGRSGLAQVTPPSGTLISYSADAGQRANDGLFTAVLIDEIQNSGLPILRVFASTREKVRQISTEWAKEDAEKGLPVPYRRVRHEPAEYNKLNLSGLDFTFTRGIPKAVSAEESAETVALRKQVESMKQLIEELRKSGVENETLKKQLAEMEKTVVEAEAKPRTKSKVTMPVPPKGNFAAGTRRMEGSKAGEVREFGGIEMVWCPPGEFLMGSPESEEERGDDEKQHRVTLTKGFWMAKTECTQGQWESVTRYNPSKFKGAKLPVEHVRWEDCQEWLAKMNAKHPLPEGWKWELPSEAQWEYACRAGTETVFAYGDSLGSKHANFNGGYPYGGAPKGSYLEKTSEVGSYARNEWGLLDMHGNVSEWCSDWYGGDYYVDGQRDPMGPNVGRYRVDRGGSWLYNAQGCRAANRNGSLAGLPLLSLGFRVALSSLPVD